MSRRATNKRDILAEYKRAREGGGRKWKASISDDLPALFLTPHHSQRKTQTCTMKLTRISTRVLSRVDCNATISLKTMVLEGMQTMVWMTGATMMSKQSQRRNAFPNVSCPHLYSMASMTSFAIAKKKAKSAKTKQPPPPSVAPSISDYRPKPSAQTESDFMASLMGSMANMTPDNTTKMRKRKPRSPSPVSSPASYLGYRRTTTYADTSSDGFSEDPGAASSDPDITSPKKRPKMSNEVGLTPAVEKMGRVTVGCNSSDFDDSAFDAFDDIDMDDLADLEVDLQDIKPLKLESKEIALSSLSPLSKPSVVVKEEEIPSWLNVHAACTQR